MKLNIIRASAGSGKTYTLTYQYIKICIQKPGNYKHILAVTFTNKATDEMKNRIIKELTNLKDNPKHHYMKDLCRDLSLSEKEVMKNAEKTLSLILHNYSFFMITTIDSFFQSVLKAFAKELGLPLNRKSELDNEVILKKAVDAILNDIADKPELKKYLSDYQDYLINSGKGMIKSDEIVIQGKEIFKERFRKIQHQLLEKLENKDELSKIINELDEKRKQFEEKAVAISKEALALIKNAGLKYDDFSGKKRAFTNTFNKIIDQDFRLNSTFIKAVDNVEKWYTKTSPKKDEIIALFPELNKSVKVLQEHFDTNFRLYNTSKIITPRLFILGILSDIANKVSDILQEENLIMFSETTMFLQEIISETDTPFIYEKIGNRYKYFMIDEFQDTSEMQWKNFKPLIQNSLSEGYSGLLVGDIKQAIYRWRNGDWTLLSHKVESQIPPKQTNATSLSHNWRSTKNVIDFNNLFFEKAASIFQDKYNSVFGDSLSDDNPFKSLLVDAYSDAKQEVPEHKSSSGGYIEIASHEKELIFDQLGPQIIELINRGYKPEDIAIIIRNNSTAQEIIDFLFNFLQTNFPNNYPFGIMSADSLIINNCPAIKFILLLSKSILNPENNIINFELLKHYFEHINYNEEQLRKILINPKKYGAFDEVVKNLNLHENELKKYRNQPCFETIEMMISKFKLGENTAYIAYLEAFQDIVKAQTEENNSSLYRFINWYEESKEVSLPADNRKGAVTIISIHKSKGLEYKAVLLPETDWNLSLNNNLTLYEGTANAGTNHLPIYPVKESSKLLDSDFANVYRNEQFMKLVDNLNMLYVAQTRAENELYIYLPTIKPSKSKKEEKIPQKIHSLIYEVYKNMGIDFSDVYTMGEKTTIEGKNTDSNKNTIKKLSYNSFDIYNRLKVKQLNLLDRDNKNRVFGIIIHDMLSKIKYKTDIESITQRSYSEGLITRKEKIAIQETLSQAFQNKEISKWFSTEYEVFTENSILSANSGIRPDRVMVKDKEAIVVDYKTGAPKAEHEIQIVNYKKELKNIGYTNIKGYLWYLSNNAIQEV